MTQDAFELLGIAPRFDLDPKELDQRVRELSRALHPDRYSASSAGERRRALSRAIDVNEAQRLLKDPLQRAELLRARIASGHAIEAKASKELLMTMLEQREALGDARRAGDIDEVRRLAEPILRRERELLDALATLFASGLQGEAVDVAQIDEKLGELRYVRRFLQEVRLLEDEL